VGRLEIATVCSIIYPDRGEFRYIPRNINIYCAVDYVRSRVYVEKINERHCTRET
jgi:hypothetical protein